MYTNDEYFYYCCYMLSCGSLNVFCVYRNLGIQGFRCSGFRLFVVWGEGFGRWGIGLGSRDVQCIFC